MVWNMEIVILFESKQSGHCHRLSHVHCDRGHVLTSGECGKGVVGNGGARPK